MNAPFYYLSTQTLVIILLILLFGVLIVSVLLAAGVMSKAPHAEKARLAKQKINRILLDCLESKITITTAVKKLEQTPPEFILKQLIDFEDRFNSLEWGLIKQSISLQYLLPKARRYVKSFSWVKRNFAANTFAIAPLLEDMKNILLLVDDPQFLVSSIAATAALRLEQKESVMKIIRRMGETCGFAHSYYRDLILQNLTTKNALLIEKVAAECKEDAVHLACLNLLLGKTLDFSLPFLWDDLKSQNSDIRMAAIKLFVHHPHETGLPMYLKWLEDPNENIRIEAIKGIEYFPSPEIFNRLTNCLSDKAWKVRLQAAKTLKKLAPQGIEVLKAQTPTQNNTAYEVAQYALNFY